MQNLEGRAAIVTGAANGIGPYIARELAKEKMNLSLSDLPSTKLEGVVEAIRAAGGRAVAVPADLADKSSLQTLVSRAEAEFGATQVLVNNASLHTVLAYHQLQPEVIEGIIRVNLTGSMLLTRMVLPGMLNLGDGHLVNISSLSGKTSPPFCEVYAATKAGLIAFTESLRSEYRSTGVSASVICPGFVEAGMYQRMREEVKTAPPRFLGTSSPETVALAIVRAIKKDVGEIIVNPGPTRLLTCLAELSPSLGEFVMRISGVSDWFRTCANARANLQQHDKVYT